MTENTSPVINARPRFLTDGEVRSDLNTALLDMQLRLPLSGMACLEARFVNWRANEADGDADFPFREIEFGQTLEVVPGEQGSEPIFSGEITGIEERYGSGAPQVVLLAEDKLHRLARQRHNRAFEEQSIADVIDSIAGEADLRADAEVGDARETWHQLNESNLAFLQRLLGPYDIALRIEGDLLRAKSEEPDSEPAVLHPQNNVRELRIIADLNHQPEKAVVRGFNADADDKVDAENDALTPSLRGTTAADLLSDLGWGVSETFPQPFPRTQAEAEGWASGRFHHRAKRFLHGDILCTGLPTMRSGREVELQGVSPKLQGVYQVVDCRHCFDSSAGYTTRLSVQRGDHS